jgi:hypothetical protein
VRYGILKLGLTNADDFPFLKYCKAAQQLGGDFEHHFRRCWRLHKATRVLRGRAWRHARDQLDCALQELGARLGIGEAEGDEAYAEYAHDEADQYTYDEYVQEAPSSLAFSSGPASVSRGQFAESSAEELERGEPGDTKN